MEKSLPTGATQISQANHSSHHHRKLSVCPNCGTSLKPRDNFCFTCGQENHELKLPLGHIIYEFVESITHFDNKLWNSLKAIFTRPGQITVEFLEGKRIRYVPPARLYVFVSVIFFFLVGRFVEHRTEKSVETYSKLTSDTTTATALLTLSDFIENDSLLAVRKLRDVAKIEFRSPLNQTGLTQAAKRIKYLNSYQQDSLLRKAQLALNDQNRRRLHETIALIPDVPSLSSELNLGFGSITFRNDSTRRAFLERVKHLDDQQIDSVLTSEKVPINTFTRAILRQSSKIMDANHEGRVANLTHAFVKNLSFVMFILMPFVAILLLLIYYRHGRYYYEHLIFSVHIHTIIFLFLSVVLGVSLLFEEQIAISMLSWTLLICWLYFLLSLRAVYQQGWFKTTLKFLLLTFSYSIIATLFMVGAFIWGFMTF